ncbi:hypothetical protein Golomagni_06503, partial [Golovinomyces magnicellulatus]
KRSRDTVETEDDFLNRPEVKISLPDELKLQLVDDWENITKNGMLVPLPRKPCVKDILQDYKKHYLAHKRDGAKRSPHVVDEVLKGLKLYFDRSLGQNLLYRFERAQYVDYRKKNGPKMGDGDVGNARSGNGSMGGDMEPSDVPYGRLDQHRDAHQPGYKHLAYGRTRLHPRPDFERERPYEQQPPTPLSGPTLGVKPNSSLDGTKCPEHDSFQCKRHAEPSRPRRLRDEHRRDAIVPRRYRHPAERHALDAASRSADGVRLVPKGDRALLAPSGRGRSSARLAHQRDPASYREDLLGASLSSETHRWRCAQLWLQSEAHTDSSLLRARPFVKTLTLVISKGYLDAKVKLSDVPTVAAPRGAANELRCENGAVISQSPLGQSAEGRAVSRHNAICRMFAPSHSLPPGASAGAPVSLHCCTSPGCSSCRRARSAWRYIALSASALQSAHEGPCRHDDSPAEPL